MSTVRDLVSAAHELLTEAEEFGRDSAGNGGRTPRLLLERASVLANLAVATGLAEQSEQSARTANAVDEARAALAAVTAKVAGLETQVPALQATAAAATPKLAELGGRQSELAAGLAQVREQLTVLAGQVAAAVPAAGTVL